MNTVLAGNEEFCACKVVHEDAVAQVRAAGKGGEELERIGGLFRMFSDPTRLRILYALAERELCVCDIGVALDLSQSAASHQLATLRAAGLVRPRREGKIVFYSLDDAHVDRLLAMGAEHATERAPKGPKNFEVIE